MTIEEAVEARDKRGWGFSGNSRKTHYFTESGRSLCGRWLFAGLLENSNHGSPDNCKECNKRREKLYPAPPTREKT